MEKVVEVVMATIAKTGIDSAKMRRSSLPRGCSGSRCFSTRPFCVGPRSDTFDGRRGNGEV